MLPARGTSHSTKQMDDDQFMIPNYVFIAVYENVLLTWTMSGDSGDVYTSTDRTNKHIEHTS